MSAYKWGTYIYSIIRYCGTATTIDYYLYVIYRNFILRYRERVFSGKVKKNAIEKNVKP